MSALVPSRVKRQVDYCRVSGALRLCLGFDETSTSYRFPRWRKVADNVQQRLDVMSVSCSRHTSEAHGLQVKRDLHLKVFKSPSQRRGVLR